MKRTFEVYANYGCLAHEKKPLYHSKKKSESYDKITLELPEDFEAYRNIFGELLVKTPTGETLLLDDIINNAGCKPCFRWVTDKGQYYTRILNTVMREIVTIYGLDEEVEVDMNQKTFIDQDTGYTIYVTENGRWIAEDDALGEWVQIKG